MIGTGLSVHEVFQHFRRIRGEFAEVTEDTDRGIREGALLGIGILLGGGFPGSAAAVSVMVERSFPEVEEWPWEPMT